MSDISIAGSIIRVGSNAISISQLGKNGVSTTHTVYNNGKAELKRCKQISGKEICLKFVDKKEDRHGVSRIASEGLEKCYTSSKAALLGKNGTAEKVIKTCETMYAFARSDGEMNPAPKLAAAKEIKAPEKPLK